MKKLFILSVFISFFGFQSKAQEGNSLVHLDYSVGVPFSDLKNFVSKSSFRGFELNLLFFTNQNVAIGVGTKWNSFYEKIDRSTYSLDDAGFSGDVTATQWNYIYFSPVYAYVGYYFNDATSTLKPFVQVGIGSAYVEELKVIGIYNSFTTDWVFSVNPSVGLLYEVPDSGIGFNCILGYNYHDFNGEIVRSPSYLSFSAGITFYP